MAKKSVVRIVFSQIGGFIVFLILLAVANYLVRFIPIGMYKEIVYFFNNNIFLLFLMSFFVMISEIFWSFVFPFSLGAPIISAIASMFIVNFIYRFWNLLNLYIKTGVELPVKTIYAVIFLLVLIIGYIVVLVKFLGRKKEEEEKLKERKKLEKVGWREIGNEFRLIFYNAGRSVNKLFEKSKKRKSS